MKDRGVYVWESFVGLTELAAIDGGGHTVRQLTVPTALCSSHDVREMWRFLDSISPPSMVAAAGPPRARANRATPAMPRRAPRQLRRRRGALARPRT